jgi:hypothetical protein
MNKICVLTIVAMLVGCAAPQPRPTAISFYDDCATTKSSFIAMVACGKENRNFACQHIYNECSAAGNAIVQYADSLAQSVKNHEMTEAEAKRQWIEFRMTQENAQKQQALQRAAIGAAIMSSPTTCYTNGDVTHCY